MNGSLNEAQAGSALRPLTQDTLSASELKSYEPEFELVFTRRDIRNIAVSGTTASNKSAVINSWKASHEPTRWLTVSLPHFNGSASPVRPIEMEDAVINQIVGQMDVAKSPKTRFRSLMKRNHASDALIAVACAGFIALTIFLIWAASLLPSSRPAPILCGLALAAWIASIGYGIYQVIRTSALSRLANRLKLKSNDIELATGPSDSRIERYMGDLVYLLDTNDFDTIVFEDLDTYQYLPLFERLRALNSLANSKRDETRAPLRFIYLVGDGLFDNPHDRTRFFDYIIPVIPFIDPSNVLMQFKAGLSEAGIEVDDDFLADLSLFVDDPNILRDIVNEAHHYKAGLLDGDDLAEGNMERLIALLTFKALFPRDFDLLQHSRGYVNALLKSRPAIIAELKSRREDASRELSVQLESARKADDSQKADELERRLEESKLADVEYSRKPLSDLIAEMSDPEPFFADPPYRQGLDDRHLHSTLASPYFPFIRFAVTGGWIDSTYERFLSNFYTESLSYDDRALIDAITQGAPVAHNRPVDNPFAVVSHVEAGMFSRESARVFALLEHLLAYGPTDKLRSFFAGIEHDDDVDWLLEYAESPSFDSGVFACAEQLLDQPIARIVSDERIEAERRRRFCHRLMAYAHPVMGNEQLRKAVVGFAQDDPRFLHVEGIEPMAISAALEEIGYKATALDATNCSLELLQFVYDRNLYEPIAPVVDNLVAGLLETSSALEEGFLVTRIFSLKGTAVKSRVAANADKFLESLLDATRVKLLDSTEAIGWMVNAKKLSPKRALSYLKALSDDVVIDRINVVDNYTYQSLLLDRQLVENTPENILDYYISAGNIVDEHLAGFLKANPFPTGFTMATTEGYLGSESGFLKAVIQCDELPDEKVAEITEAYRAQFNHFDMEGLSEMRTAMLVANGIIRATPDNLSFVRKTSPSAASSFAKVDPETYTELVLPDKDGNPAPCGFVRNEALDVFDMRGVADVIKSKLLEGFNEPVSLSRKYSNDLNAAIASTHFNEADLGLVDELYLQGNRKLKRALAEAIAACSQALSREGLLLSMELVADVAWRMRENRADMISFITQQLGDRDPEPTRLEVRSIFERAGLDEYVALIDGPSAVIPDAPEDDALLAALAHLGMAGKQTGKPDWQGLRRVNSKGYSRK